MSGMNTQPSDRHASIGATLVSDNVTHFRVWAPKREFVVVEAVNDRRTTRHPLNRDVDGYFAGSVKGITNGTLYQFNLDGNVSRPDPASRYQPQGVHGPSQVIDPNAFPWTDCHWQGLPKRDLVIYELHVGSFTNEGTFHAAERRIEELKSLGVTAVEIMPVAQSPGKWNWGYDGVNLFAVRNTFGTPDDFRSFVDACHASGIAVFLDVVYNHLGPEGNYLSEFGPYFTRRHHTPWGEAFNFDGRRSKHVREFIIQNAIFWLDEYHLDGLRLDAVHFLFDNSEVAILTELRQAVLDYEQSSRRKIHLIAEANVFDRQLLQPDVGHPYDAIWCDCLMHSIYSHGVPKVRLTQRRYQGAEDIANALARGYLFAGAQMTRIPTTSAANNASDRDRFVDSFVVALQTHDSVGNHPLGQRIHHLTSIDFQKAAATLVLLYPAIPMIFMGEECAADCYFSFFADFEDADLRRRVDQGRQREYTHHDWAGAVRPSDPKAFLNSKVTEAPKNESVQQWYQQILRFRKDGIKQKWLNSKSLQTNYHAEHCLFTLAYDTDNEGHITIFVRLDTNSRAEPIAIPSSGNVVLDSRETNSLEQLLPVHAVVCRADK